MSEYKEIVKILKDFFEDNIDKTIGELTLNEISELADKLDNLKYFKNKTKNVIKIEKI